MKDHVRLAAVIWLILATTWPPASQAQMAGEAKPTYSIRLKSINGTQISGLGVSSFKVAPGDRLEFDLTIRDWSPNGEMAAAVQATLLSSSFTSGQAGSILPVAYETTTARGVDNSKNAIIDTSNIKYLHYGKETVSYVDSITSEPGYRWLSMLFGKIGPISRQDGTERYIGSVKSIVSNDAQGTFEYSLSNAPADAVVLTFDKENVLGIQAESTTLTVTDQPTRQWIVSSRPAWGHVEATQPGDSKGISSVTLRMRMDADNVSASDIAVTSTNGTAPKVKSVRAQGRNLTVELSGSIPAEAWTTITHVPSGSSMKMARMYGDTNSDGYCDFDDLAHALDQVNERGEIALSSGDLNGDTSVDAVDMIQLLDTLCN
ncbi:MAG: hypothetical protein ACYTHJ_11250 [Planctomycetota bacterium]